MTTRNQKRRANANLKPPSNSETVDFENQPVVALPATNPHSSRSDLEGNCDANLNSCGSQPDPTKLKNSSSAVASATLKNPSSPAPATPVITAAEKPPITTTSNPVLRDICDLKSGELKIVSPAVSKYFGFPAGPVENLNFNDPKVAEFFNIPLPQPTADVLGTVPATGLSVQASGAETAALVPVSGPLPKQNSTAATVPPTSAAPLIPVAATDALQQGNSLVMGGEKVCAGGSARPVPMAAEKPHSNSPTIPPTSWAGLFKDNRALNDDTKMNPNFVGVTSDVVEWVEDDLEDVAEEKRSLIGFFNGKFPGIKAIQHIVDSWSRKCTFEHHNSGWLVFEFDEEVDCDVVLKEGPYYAFNKPLVLKKMPEYFDFSDDAYSTAPVWIQLPNLPLRAWKKSALEKVCTFLGTPLHIDQVTKEKKKKSFARCLVDIDVSKDLPNIVCCKFPGGKILRQHVLYEEVPTFCTNCKKLGHETEECFAKNNGKPSLYVTRSKKDREKNAGNKNMAGVAKGVDKGLGKQPSAAASRPVAAAPLAANAAASGHGNLGMDAAGNFVGGKVTRQPDSTNNALVSNNSNPKEMASKNGKLIETNAKAPGFVSNNSFGPLATGKVGSWAEEAEASNARNNNNKKRNNVRKK